MLQQKILSQAIEAAVGRVKSALVPFENAFPGAATGPGYRYPITDNSDWTNSFWSGLLWLCWELTGEDCYLKAAKQTCVSFRDRMAREVNVDFHDLGFLYSLSCVADWKLTGDAAARACALEAADRLARRFQSNGNFIQAWGRMGDPDEYRLIIDCYMNLPLLFWASAQTGDPRYAEIARLHAHTAAETVFRPDGSAFHTFYFDPATGKPVRGVTHQGYRDDSAWARGQSWAVCGLPLYAARSGDDSLNALWQKATAYFIAQLPKDGVPYWDLCFGEGSGQPRDTSAAAIAVCGLLEADRQNLPGSAAFVPTAEKILVSLMTHYTRTPPDSTALLSDGLYNRRCSMAPEGTLFGDYFYLEALARAVKPDRELYW